MNHRETWTWLCDRVPLLRRWRYHNEAAIFPSDDDIRVGLLYAMADPQIREAVLDVLRPDIETMIANTMEAKGAKR